MFRVADLISIQLALQTSPTENGRGIISDWYPGFVLVIACIGLWAFWHYLWKKPKA